LYEYQCAECGRFEVIRKFADEPLTKCPTCGRDINKLPSAPAIQFKGTGWYITDYARKSSGGEGKSEGGSKDGSSKDGGSKDGGSKDSGSKESGGSKDSGSKDSGSSDSSSKPAAAKDTSTSGSGSTKS
jgi:putative FmdB family regulatory protein